MISLAKLAYIDQTSDGKTDDDIFGITGRQWIPFIGFLHACDINLVEQDDAGNYLVAVYNEKNQAKTTDLVEKLHDLSKSDCSWFSYKNEGPERILLTIKRTLMSIAGTPELVDYLDYDLDFGVLPYPMYDEAQKDVGYRSLQWGGFLCIPSYVSNPDMVGDTVEMLSFFSEDVNNAYYDRVLGKQSADSPDDRRMLMMVWDGICSEFIQAYYNVALESRILYMMPDLTDKSTDTSLASFMATWTGTVNKKVSKFLYAVRKKQ
jgi:hypothetical protein